MSQLVDFREDVRSDKPLKVDRAKGVIENVKILGLKSANGRTYLEAGLQAAVPKYEGRKVYTNHNRDGEPHPVEDTLGWFEGVRFVTGEGLRGSFNFVRSHPMANVVAEIAERNPSLVGMSHHAHGEERTAADGQSIIESIHEVYSVDLVSDPATTSGLKESRKMTQATKITVKAWKEKQTAGSQLRRVAELFEEAGMGDMPMAEPAAAGSSEDQIWAAFKSAIMAAVDDEGLDIKATLKRIGEILKSYEKLSGSGSSEPPPPEPGTQESKKASDEVKALREEITIRDLIESNSLKFGKPEARTAFVKALVSLTPTERTALIEERKSSGAGGGTGHKDPPVSGGNGDLPPPKETTVFEDSEDARRKRLSRFRGTG